MMTPRCRLAPALAIALLMLTPCLGEDVRVWVGTTTPRNGLSRGIYHARLNLENGRLSPATLVGEIANPGFLAAHPTQPVLYSTGARDGQPVVAAWTIAADGLTELNVGQIPTGGGAAHLTTDRSGQFLFTAHYGGGVVGMFRLRENGAVGAFVKSVPHEGGSGVVGRRQDKPHPHWVGTDPSNKYLFVPDLGMDRVVIYRFDADAGELSPHGMGVVPPGSGPRHMKFHPDGKHVFVLNELSLTVTTFAWDAQAGTLTPLQTIPTVPEELKAKETFVSASEIRVHPSGRYVYAANRGHDTVTAFRVDAKSGQLALIEREPVRGGWPRNFNIDPTGRWLVAAGRDSNTLAVFEIDIETGELTYTRNMAFAPTPICVLFSK